MSNEQFISTLSKYAEINSLRPADVAKNIKRSQRTVGHWFTIGIKSDNRRVKVMEELPEIFSGEYLQSKPSKLASITGKSENVVNQVQLLTKIGLAQYFVSFLSEILSWFLFKATADEREQFRDGMGDSWKSFLELTRAMTGEHALEIAIKERRIKDVNSHG